MSNATGAKSKLPKMKALQRARRANAEDAAREPLAGTRTSVPTDCRHCETVDCYHCPATESGQHDVEFGDMQVVDSAPVVVSVEIYCSRCGDRAGAVVVESNFEWEGTWRDEPYLLKGDREFR